MYARAVDAAAARLRELRDEAWGDAAVAILSMGLAIGATRLRPELAVPLLLGGLALSGLAMRAFVRRWELLDGLLLDRDAYAIPEVRARAERAATAERRRYLSFSIRSVLDGPLLRTGDGAAAYRAELEELAAELDDPALALDPFCAVACERLLGGTIESPLYTRQSPPEDVLSQLRRIRAGFTQAVKATNEDGLALAPRAVDDGGAASAQNRHARMPSSTNP